MSQLLCSHKQLIQTVKFNQDKPKLPPQPLQISRRSLKYQMIHQLMISKLFSKMKFKKLSMTVTKCCWVPTHLFLPVSFFSQKIQRVAHNDTFSSCHCLGTSSVMMSPWTHWSVCSATCLGIRTRSRLIDNIQSIEREECNSGPCGKYIVTFL